MQQIPDVVVQSTEDRHDGESARHPHEIASVAAARLGQHPYQEHTQKRAVGIPKDADNNGNHP